MLLQINEPSATTKEKTSYAIGIDFGTTNSVVAYMGEDHVIMIPGEDGSILIPSVVSINEDNQCMVGENPASFQGVENLASVRSVKRLLAKKYEDISTLPTFLSDQVIQANENKILLKMGAATKQPIEIAAEIFKAIKARASQFLKQEVKEAVVTVPAYFDDAARAAIRDAAKLAGLDTLRLIAEPTAAALAYGLDDKKEGCYMVYDLGGGTFDVSILRMQKGVFQVLSTGGHEALGGDDIDALIVDYLYKEQQLSGIEKKKALMVARRLKEQLSIQDEARFPLEEGVDKVVTRQELEMLIKPLVNQTIELCHNTLKESGLHLEELSGILLVGGSTRTPLIQENLQTNFQKEIFCTLDPDQVVAMGAARQAQLLTQGGEAVLIDVSPLSLGVEIMGGMVDKIIPRNSPIPIQKAQKFTTFQDNQTGMILHIVQGEREMAKDCRSLGTFELAGIPAMPAGIPEIMVTFAIDADGLLTVSAQEETTGIHQKIIIKPTYGLSEEEMKDMLIDSHRYGKEDMEARLLSQSIIESKALIVAIKKAIEKDGDLLSKGEISQIQESILGLESAMLEGKRQQVEQQKEILDQLTEKFAQQRMARLIKK